MELNKIKIQAVEEIHEANDLKELTGFEVKYLGRKGIITQAFGGLKDLPAEQKKRRGAELNIIREELEEAIRIRKAEIAAIGEAGALRKEWVDVTLPGKKPARGHLHPRAIVLRQVENIFQSMGFSVVDGPELETDWYNFEALNIPKDHPARDMQDTFYVKNPAGGPDLVMRTQTSPVQVRYMEKNAPPLRIIAPGRVFRREATDASHESQFYQLEGLMVDKHISVANFKAIIEEFFRIFYGRKIAIRLRPSFFPFTEPSFEFDMGCVICNKKGCSVCSQMGWIEVIPGGMVNQKVFEAAGYARNEWQGFAFGMGLDRLVMMKYGIDDIRLLNGGDLRFLKQF